MRDDTYVPPHDSTPPPPCVVFAARMHDSPHTNRDRYALKKTVQLTLLHTADARTHSCVPSFW